MERYQKVRDVVTGLVVETMIKKLPATFIPMNTDNTDYIAYLAWLAEGNQPEAAE